MFLENLSIALKAIWANKMRSVLTTLGIIVGVSSVIAVVSLVQGMQFSISNELQGVGSTYIIVVPEADREHRTMDQRIPELNYQDGLAVLRQAPEIKEFTPIFFTGAQTKFRDNTHSTTLLGVGESYQEVVNHWVDRGRFFTPLDVEARKRVALVGIEAAKKLGIDEAPLGKSIQINVTPFTVIGIMEKKGRMFGQDNDDVVLIPFSTAAVVYGPDAVRTIRLDFQARDPKTMDLAKEQINEVLRARHHLKKDAKDDFRIILQEELLNTISKVLRSTTLVMAAVVGIALLVGGIGIMNIMLVSVTERTREIGIRKAVGARRADVLQQFLIEAITLSGVGGGLGIVFGVGLGMLVRKLLARLVEFPAVHTPLWAVGLSVGFCALLGIIFGIYPAAKASKLDPIEALRYE
ncbi:MAG: ABC transporter permease [Thermoanaerobaculia bacterium]